MCWKVAGRGKQTDTSIIRLYLTINQVGRATSVSWQELLQCSQGDAYREEERRVCQTGKRTDDATSIIFLCERNVNGMSIV